MSATRQWYPHYIRDFNAKTAHLSLAERGAYRALMDAYWEDQGPLPANERALCRRIGAFPDEWESVRDVVLGFFNERDGKLHHKRIDEEIAKARKQHSEKAERLAKARQRKAEIQSQAQSIALSTEQCTEQSSGLTEAAPSPSPSPKNGRTEEPRIAADAADVPCETKSTDPTAREILETVLSKEKASAVIKHRKLLRKPLTNDAAKLLIGGLLKCRDGPDVAVDVMIERAWLTYKPEWDDRNDQNSTDKLHDAITEGVLAARRL